MCYASDVNARTEMIRTVPGKELASDGIRQDKSIEVVGIVTDGNGEPIIGATVQVKGRFAGSDYRYRWPLTITVSDANVFWLSPI